MCVRIVQFVQLSQERGWTSNSTSMKMELALASDELHRSDLHF